MNRKPEVEHIYVQTVAQVIEFVQTRKKGGKASVDLGFLGAEVGAEGELEAKVAVTPLLQAITAEKATERTKGLIDLTKQRAIQGRLMRYIGLARFVVEPSSETPAPGLISQHEWDIVSQKRQTQEAIMKWKNKDAKAVVLTFKTYMGVYVSIASTDWLDDNLFVRYFQEPLTGILCRMEGTARSGVTFLDPIWIWHEAP